MARPSGLEKMTYAQLSTLKDKVAKLMEVKRAEHVDKVRAQIAEQVEEAGLSLDEVMGSSRAVTPGGAKKRGKVAPKFQNPKDPSQKWSGRGLKPRWMQEALSKGAKLESFRIK